MVELDNVDRGILHELQLDARNRTAQEIADKVDVSASTVRNRIDELEANGVIEGYHPKIDYEVANLPLQILFVCSAPAPERSEIVDRILDVCGVVDVRETLTGRRNLYVEAVGTGTADTIRITDALHDVGVSIERSEILRQRRVQPFDHFLFTDPYEDGPSEENGNEEETAETERGQREWSRTAPKQGDDTAADRSAPEAGDDPDGSTDWRRRTRGWCVSAIDRPGFRHRSTRWRCGFHTVPVRRSGSHTDPCGSRNDTGFALRNSELVICVSNNVYRCVSVLA